jgi:hypothetical protein
MSPNAFIPWLRIKCSEQLANGDTLKSCEPRSPERALSRQDVNCTLLFPDKVILVEPGLPGKEAIRSRRPFTARSPIRGSKQPGQT